MVGAAATKRDLEAQVLGACFGQGWEVKQARISDIFYIHKEIFLFRTSKERKEGFSWNLFSLPPMPSCATCCSDSKPGEREKNIK